MCVFLGPGLIITMSVEQKAQKRRVVVLTKQRKVSSLARAWFPTRRPIMYDCPSSCHVAVHVRSYTEYTHMYTYTHAFYKLHSAKINKKLLISCVARWHTSLVGVSSTRTVLEVELEVGGDGAGLSIRRGSTTKTSRVVVVGEVVGAL
jgi:hypothetical protein